MNDGEQIYAPWARKFSSYNLKLMLLKGQHQLKISRRQSASTLEEALKAEETFDHKLAVRIPQVHSRHDCITISHEHYQIMATQLHCSYQRYSGYMPCPRSRWFKRTILSYFKIIFLISHSSTSRVITFSCSHRLRSRLRFLSTASHEKDHLVINVMNPKKAWNLMLFLLSSSN